MFRQKSFFCHFVMAFLLTLSTPLIAQEETNIIDILIVFDEAFRKQHPGENYQEMAQELIDEANTVFANSGINNIEARLLDVVGVEEFVLATKDEVFTQPISIDIETDNAPELGYVDVWRFATHGEDVAKLDQIQAYRDAIGADVVSMIAGGVSQAYCGVARWTNANAEEAYNISLGGCAFNSDQYVFTHELGHLLGADHDEPYIMENAPFDLSVIGEIDVKTYARGRLDPNGEWSTIMAYPFECVVSGGCKRLPYFSNPDVAYQGDPSGFGAGAIGLRDAAGNDIHNNAKVIIDKAAEMAAFRTAPNANQCPGINASIADHVAAGRAVRYFSRYYARGSGDRLGQDDSVIVALLETSNGNWELQTCTVANSNALVINVGWQVEGNILNITGQALASETAIAGVKVSSSVPGSTPVLCQITDISNLFNCGILYPTEQILRYEVAAIDANGLLSAPYVLNIDPISTPSLLENVEIDINGSTATITGNVYGNDIFAAAVYMLNNTTTFTTCELNNTQFSCVFESLTSGAYELKLQTSSAQGGELFEDSFTITAGVSCSGPEYSSSNYRHRQEGRATRMSSSAYYAVGSGDFLGGYSTTTTLTETSSGYFEVCP